ncbi:hypothetical protein B296_00012136 [Ensete ventricosum]|uniref:Uncharacterized protein n=1 Tax=Ensete ventricosum TaxID=4639 RepID=A0A427B9H0_ENSVE|nr:hypothetical protein B296_00012136 [Ensete ventricosum]
MPWYRRFGTSVVTSIPCSHRGRALVVKGLKIWRMYRTFVTSSISCSHGGRVLVVKGVEEVENTEVNSKYQDKAKR